MKYYISTAVGVVIAMMIISCSPGYESKGDYAYKQAEKAQGDAARKLRKEAYIYYQRAIKAHPNRISVKLRNRYLDMVLSRASMVLDEGSAEMDALPLFIKDLDTMLNADVNDQIRTKYANLLCALADSSLAKRKLYHGLNLLEKAISVAVDKGYLEKKKSDILDNFAKENYEAAEIEYVNGATNKDAEALVRAEFMIQVALIFEKNYPGALELLGKIRKENRGTYSAYAAVVIDKPDTNIYDQVNKYDILMAVPDVIDGPGAVLKVDLYNYSNNPQRLRPQNFYVVDTNGKQYRGLASSKIDREICDQEIEAKMTLRFSKGSAPIKKLCFESDNKEYYTEKVFF